MHDHAMLSADERGRYARHLILPEVGAAGQLRLKSASVLCVGSGGLGSPLLLYLAAAKVTDNAPDKSRFSAMAKRLATDSGSNVVNNALEC